MNSIPNEPLEIRPNVKRNALNLGLVSVAFTLIGLWLIFSVQTVRAILLGGLSVICFGGGAIYGIPKMLKRGVSLVLTRESIEQRFLEGSAYIRWADIEATGIATIHSNKYVGLRLANYEDYLRSMSPSLIDFMAKQRKFLKVAAGVTSAIAPAPRTGFWSNADTPSSSEVLQNIQSIRTVADSLAWSRSYYGYGIVFVWSELDRPSEEFLALLNEYRTALGTTPEIDDPR